MEWYWNGTQDGPQRRDVIVWRDDAAWSVEQRRGDGGSTIIAARDGGDAQTICETLTTADPSWYDMTSRVERV